MSDKEKTAAEKTADEQAELEEAATPGAPAKRSPGEQSAEDAELARQDEVRAAVAKANKTELSKLGGPLKNPGLGR